MRIDIKDILGKWKEYTLFNDMGMTVSVLDYGGIITEIMVPDRNGKFGNVVLGFKNYTEYEQNHSNYFGAIIGRVAGRIEDASFEINNQPYHLEANEGHHQLHGGSKGFHQVKWSVTPFQNKKAVGIRLDHKSIDGEGGYPGNIDITVTYTLTNDNKLTLEYSATSDKTTALALTNHSYFNLNGDLKNTVENHHVTIDSGHFVELNQELIPTGRLISVDETSFDFRGGRLLKEGFEDVSVQNKIAGKGYDHYFVFDHHLENNAVVQESSSGRIMTMKTDQPGMVMYTSNTLMDGLELKEGPSRRYLGVCLETQSSPASLHHEGFPSVILPAGECYQKQTVFTFGLQS
ncbi:aldose epimerase family protein [Oceanobacillus massiliensis]|uniref:aldose epimerase family protein n=1 Tax=Oceanobacillus massiliensis TaxID=1465765 RepID=UPI000289A9CD|nr:aldose epimerase family protein [Oceanobacillus massiliensis]